MKIKKIGVIKKYKSFQDFSWNRFFNVENFHNDVNILYGENGSGKSSICNILKNVSQNKDFIGYPPKETQLLLDNTQYKNVNGVWNSLVARELMLFFDKEFVERNIQVGRDRGTQQGEQEQESGKLIIEFDGEAIRLRSVKNQLKKLQDEESKKVEEYQESNKTFLKSQLSTDEEIFFNKHKKKSKKEIKKLKEDLENRKTDLEVKTKNDHQLLQKTTEIQTIKELEDIEVNIALSSYEKYQAVFNYDLKEQVQFTVEQELAQAIKLHKEFFEQGFEIRKVYPHQCPFCQTQNEEDKIRKIINVYNRLYDNTYKKEKALFERNKQKLVDELNQIKTAIDDFNPNDIFIPLKKLAERFSIKNLYSVEEEEKFRKKLLIQNLEILKKKLIELKKPNKEDISDLYKEVKLEFSGLTKFFLDLASFVTKKNQLIKAFKKEHTNKKLVDRIEKNQVVVEGIKTELDFINSKKIEAQNMKLEKTKELRKLERVFEKAKAGHKKARDTYEQYCSIGVFTKALKKIESYFSRFNFSFKLQLDTSRNTGLTKELPFAFKVLDFDGNERDLKEGLSEGEIQVLSLCFFFAFLSIQSNRDQKVLIFDDPITSLDDSNLSNLVDLIADERKEFSQTFVFTHHRTFFKFLRKKFDRKCNEYNIIRNKNHLGGSFICESRKERFVKRLKKFESHLLRIAQNQSAFDAELKIIEYGQYLRYEIEHFIKYKLLHLGESQFAKVIDGIKSNQKVSNDDLDELKQIYSFCNWTTSHVDVGDGLGMAQLKEKISHFVTIYEKY